MKTQTTSTQNIIDALQKNNHKGVVLVHDIVSVDPKKASIIVIKSDKSVTETRLQAVREHVGHTEPAKMLVVVDEFERLARKLDSAVLNKIAVF